MNIHWRARGIPISVLCLFVGLFLLVACGSGASRAGTSATATAKCVPTAGTTQTAVGTLKSIQGQTLVLAGPQQKKLTVTYSGTTHFTRQSYRSVSSLQEGTEVSVIVTGNNGVYTATRITIVPGSSLPPMGTPGPGLGGTPPGTLFPPGTPGTFFQGTPPSGAAPSGGSNNPCRQQLQGTPGTAGPGSANSHSIVGTVGRINGDILTVIDTTGASYTITLTPRTQIIGTGDATAAALSVGEPLVVTGEKKQGVIAATTVLILLSLPSSSITNS